MAEWLQHSFVIVAAVLIVIAVLQSLIYIIELVLAGFTLTRRPPMERIGTLWQDIEEISPPISLLVPAFDEERTIVESVKSLLSLHYPSIEVVVVNDGSKDATLTALVDGFGLAPGSRAPDSSLGHADVREIYISPKEPRLVVVDKENGGKADALNCAINYARAPLICTIDADSILESDSLLRASLPFIGDPQRTIAVGATIRVANGCLVEHGRVVSVGLPRNFLPLVQTVEYLRAFLVARLAAGRMRFLTIISGAFGVFQRLKVIEAGGYSTDTVGEDYELIIKLHRLMREQRLPYRIVYVPEPVCWTEVPEQWRSLSRQRQRWQRGALETFFKHKRMLFNPRYGRIGMVGLPTSLLVDVIGPIAETLGYLFIPILFLFGWLSLDYLAAFFAVTVTIGIGVSVGSLALEEVELRRFPKARDLFVLVLVAIIENIGYRQINGVWRIMGWWQFLSGEKEWGSMSRRGFRSGATKARS